MFQKFPMCLFRVPGPFVHEGVHYDGRLAQSEEDLQAALADGWVTSLDGLKNEPAPAPQPVPQVDPAPAPAPAAERTRAELEAEATALGVKFDGRTTDAKLAERIASAKAAA